MYRIYTLIKSLIKLCLTTLFIFVVLYNTTGMSHLKVKCDCLINALRNDRRNGLAGEGSLWHVFMLGVWIVVGCADVQKISVSPFSRFLDGGTTVLGFECICFSLRASQHSVAFQNMNPVTCLKWSSCVLKTWHSEIDGGWSSSDRCCTAALTVCIPTGLLFLQHGYIHLCWIHMSQPQSGMYKQASILGGGSANTSRPVLTSFRTFL